MASACVNKISMAPENFPWLAPILSGKPSGKSSGKTPGKSSQALENTDLEFPGEFEFLTLENPVNILPADELFSGGKLITGVERVRAPVRSEVKLQEKVESFREKVENLRKKEILETDPCFFSPKAPRCSSRWKDLLGLKKLSMNGNGKTSSPLKMFYHRSSKSTGSSLESPLLPENEFVMSARLSLSSSSSGSTYEDHPRHSLDLDRLRNGQNPPRVRLSRPRTGSCENVTRMGRTQIKTVDGNNGTVRGISVDSPRMNSSGRVIFTGLERSSSSPSTFNGGNNRLKYKGMERSYSANVRVTPVLNVPVCSIKSSVFGFQMFPSNHAKKDVGTGSGNGRTRGQVNRVRSEKM